MSVKWPLKAVDEILDYSFDWVNLLADGETISTSNWSVDINSIITMSTVINTTITTIWLNAGTANVTYSFTNIITTSQGRTLERVAKLRVVGKK